MHEYSMAPSPFADLPRIKIAQGGGLKHLERILGLLQDSHRLCSLDAVFISIDLEVSRDERAKILKSSDRPSIKEYGFATLDTRDISGRSEQIGFNQLFSTHHFSTALGSRPKTRLGTAITTIRKCNFAQTNQVGQDGLLSIITKSLRIEDSNASSPGPCLRNIVIVGHSVKPDLRILQRSEIDIFTIAPVAAILDTHNMACEVLGPTSTRLNGHAPIASFTLSGVLTGLHCPHDKTRLHNAGNDATYTLFVLLKLAIRSGQARALSSIESENLKNLTSLTLIGPADIEAKE